MIVHAQIGGHHLDTSLRRIAEQVPPVVEEDCVFDVFFDVAGDDDAAFGVGTDDVEPGFGGGAGSGVAGLP